MRLNLCGLDFMHSSTSTKCKNHYWKSEKEKASEQSPLYRCSTFPKKQDIKCIEIFHEELVLAISFDYSLDEKLYIKSLYSLFGVIHSGVLSIVSMFEPIYIISEKVIELIFHVRIDFKFFVKKIERKTRKNERKL